MQLIIYVILPNADSDRLFASGQDFQLKFVVKDRDWYLSDLYINWFDKATYLNDQIGGQI